MKRLGDLVLMCAIGVTAPAHAEVVSASDSHFTLRHDGHTSRSVEDTWQRLIRPSSWWDPRHSYSGDAANISLELEVGGLWREDWDGGSVAHGTVLFIDEEKTLRLEAPFGPLQGMGAYVVWTITLEAAEEGTNVVFEESAIGPAGANYQAMAEAVDGVKTEAMRNLTAEK
ncbi:MAG: SRPBCC domain-containing protein [Pseudomonadota bacterium]